MLAEVAVTAAPDVVAVVVVVDVVAVLRCGQLAPKTLSQFKYVELLAECTRTQGNFEFEGHLLLQRSFDYITTTSRHVDNFEALFTATMGEISRGG